MLTIEEACKALREKRYFDYIFKITEKKNILFVSPLYDYGDGCVEHGTGLPFSINRKTGEIGVYNFIKHGVPNDATLVKIPEQYVFKGEIMTLKKMLEGKSTL